MKNIKRSITVKQSDKKKKFYLKKKSFWSRGKSRQNFRMFDEEGYEIFDIILLDILFDKWITNSIIFDMDNVVTSISLTDYNLFNDTVIDNDVIEEELVEPIAPYGIEEEEFQPIEEEVVPAIEEVTTNDTVVEEYTRTNTSYEDTTSSNDDYGSSDDCGSSDDY